MLGTETLANASTTVVRFAVPVLLALLVGMLTGSGGGGSVDCYNHISPTEEVSSRIAYGAAPPKSAVIWDGWSWIYYCPVGDSLIVQSVAIDFSVDSVHFPTNPNPDRVSCQTVWISKAPLSGGSNYRVNGGNPFAYFFPITAPPWGTWYLSNIYWNTSFELGSNNLLFINSVGRNWPFFDAGLTPYEGYTCDNGRSGSGWLLNPSYQQPGSDCFFGHFWAVLHANDWTWEDYVSIPDAWGCPPDLLPGEVGPPTS